MNLNEKLGDMGYAMSLKELRIDIIQHLEPSRKLIKKPADSYI